MKRKDEDGVAVDTGRQNSIILRAIGLRNRPDNEFPTADGEGNTHLMSKIQL